MYHRPIVGKSKYQLWQMCACGNSPLASLCVCWPLQYWGKMTQPYILKLKRKPDCQGKIYNNWRSHTLKNPQPTVCYWCEFEHCVEGASQIRQLIFRGKKIKCLSVWSIMTTLLLLTVASRTYKLEKKPVYAEVESGSLYLQVCLRSRPADSALSLDGRWPEHFPVVPAPWWLVLDDGQGPHRTGKETK